MKKHFIILSFLSFILTDFVYCQNLSFPDIDPKWEYYYDNNPSGIVDKYAGQDFIKVIDLVGFIPQDLVFENDVKFLKILLLRIEGIALRQMSLLGDYHSRTFKHYDYYELYNIYYKKIDKQIWDKYCPYLLPLMHIDKVLNLK
jgi:hypothetical protein